MAYPIYGDTITQSQGNALTAVGCADDHRARGILRTPSYLQKAYGIWLHAANWREVRRAWLLFIPSPADEGCKGLLLTNTRKTYLSFFVPFCPIAVSPRSNHLWMRELRWSLSRRAKGSAGGLPPAGTPPIDVELLRRRSTNFFEREMATPC